MFELAKYIVDADDAALVGKYTWMMHPGYFDLPHTRLEDGRVISLARYILVNIHGHDIQKHQVIVHVNGNRGDNRKENLVIGDLRR